MKAEGGYVAAVGARALTRSYDDAVGDRRSGLLPTFALSESKLRRPAARPGIVGRPALVDRLSSVDTPAVISVVAPAGYGKTTLLAQWAESWQPRVAWVSADHRDNDPAVLLTYLATALDRVEPIAPAVLRTLAFPGAAITVVPLLASAIMSMRQPVALVLDDAEAITNRECIDTITELALSFPAGSQFAIASRDTVLLPVSRLRAQRGIIEIGADDLAMSEPGGGRAAQRRRRRRRRARRRRPRPTHRGLARRPLPRRAGDASREPARRSRVLGHR